MLPKYLLRITFFLFILPLSASAQIYKRGINFDLPQLLEPYYKSAPEIASESAVLLDFETGIVLYSKNPNIIIPPASLTKLMTMHLIQKEVDQGRISLDDIVPIGVESWAIRQPSGSSLMFLEPGQYVTLREIMLGLAVSSGNDAAVAAALFLAPTVEEFVYRMNIEARNMGLIKTSFVEPSGVSEFNFTCASDFAVFCREYLYQHPKSLSEFHSVPEFDYPKSVNVSSALKDKPGTISQANRNRLLKTFPGVDGMKTGYIIESGYNIALTAKRNNTRFILILLGAPGNPGGERIRDNDAQKLLSWAFDNFRTMQVNTGEIEGVRLWKGKKDRAELKSAEKLIFTIPFDRGVGTVQYQIWINEPLIAPLPSDSPVGYMTFFDEFGEIARVQIVTKEDYQEGNIFWRIWESIVLFFKNLF